MNTCNASRLVKFTPCKDCDKRQLGCHSKCEDYAIYRQHLNEIRLDLMNEQKIDGLIMKSHLDKRKKFIKKVIGKRARGVSIK